MIYVIRMADRALSVVLTLLLLAAWARPTYCAEMLNVSTPTPSTQHHHHQVDDAPAATSQLHIVAASPQCSDCGDIGLAALTPDGHSRLVVEMEQALESFDARVYPTHQNAAVPHEQDTSPDLPSLVPLRI